MLEELERLGGASSVKGVSFGNRRHFVACFCESDELLSMWRAYAGNAGGYCIGLDYSQMKHSMCWPGLRIGESHPLLAPVHYGNTPESIRSFLSAARWRHIDAETSRDLPPFFPSMIKHESFAEEREWRIIALDPPVNKMKFRSGGANIKPYVELAWLRLGEPAKLPITSITVGPTLRSDDQPDQIIGWMLEQNGYEGAPVRLSKIPFRL